MTTVVWLLIVALIWAGIWYALHRIEYYIEMSDCEPRLDVAILYQVVFPALFVLTVAIAIFRLLHKS